jgi:hypothetical protein
VSRLARLMMYWGAATVGILIGLNACSIALSRFIVVVTLTISVCLMYIVVVLGMRFRKCNTMWFSHPLYVTNVLASLFDLGKQILCL